MALWLQNKAKAVYNWLQTTAVSEIIFHGVLSAFINLCPADLLTRWPTYPACWVHSLTSVKLTHWHTYTVCWVRSLTSVKLTYWPSDLLTRRAECVHQHLSTLDAHDVRCLRHFSCRRRRRGNCCRWRRCLWVTWRVRLLTDVVCGRLRSTRWVIVISSTWQCTRRHGRLASITDAAVYNHISTTYCLSTKLPQITSSSIYFTVLATLHFNNNYATQQSVKMPKNMLARGRFLVKCGSAAVD